MAKASLWWAGARPKTLPAAIVPVAVGTAAANVEPIWWRAIAALVVSLSLQIGTNYVNDYADGERGTDQDRIGPLRLVGSGQVGAGAVKRAAALAFGVAGVVGFALAAAVGWELLVVGAASILAGWAYTGGPRPYGYYGMGEIFVFVFFGLVATVGSAYVQVEAITTDAVLAAIPVGLLAVAMLVVNNLRDIPGDTQSGKKTMAVRMGDANTRTFYVALMVATALTIGVLATRRPGALLGLLALTSAFVPIRQIRSGARGAELIPTLGATGRVQLITGVGLALGLAIA